MPVQLSVDQAKQRILLMVSNGATVANALASAGKSQKTYERYRNLDREFAAQVDNARLNVSKAKANGQDSELYQLSFAEWRKRYLRRETYPHMQNLIDVLEGRDPSWLHDSMTWEPAAPDRIVMNIPVFHAKSQTVTVDWVTYKLCMNPNLQVLIVSKKQEFAKKFLYQIKQRFESNLYGELQAAYGGPNGFKGDVWSANMIYLAGRDSDEKDPNVEAVGLGGQIYGSRADIIILDDCIVGSNAAQFEKQIEWIESEVENRVFDGLIAFVGTRLAPQDLYSEITRGTRYMSGKSPWTYFAMPMVLEYAEDPEDWVTLWPQSHRPMDRTAEADKLPNGMYRAWDGTKAAKTRAGKPPRVFELVYQQRAISGEMTFTSTCVWGSVDKRRKPGPLIAGAWGHPRNGAEGMHIIGTIDPAGTGEAFILIYAVDRATRKRYVLNAWMGNQTTVKWYRDRMKELTPVYGVAEWVIESNAYANWLIHDEDVIRWTQETGVRVVPTFTGRNKQDPDFGVTTLAPLFGSVKKRDDGNGNTGQEDHAGDNLIHLPDPDKSPGVRALIEQLLIWEPGKRGNQLRQDGPMALWFGEIRARAHTLGGDKPAQTHASHSRFISQRARRRQGVMPVGLS